MHQVDKIIEAAWNGLRSYEQTVRDLKTVGYKGEVAILRGPYDGIIGEAIKLRRRNIADCRAQAVELAFDAHLKRATDGAWMRVGEVAIDRQERVVRAFCITNEELAKTASAPTPEPTKEA